ncbi:hypothetical protein HOC87_00985 [Candidatus Bathyarchaeota archaeon]|nr:hypothetical protein [Candidatus Bathyarchaeota archaeon]
MPTVQAYENLHDWTEQDNQDYLQISGQFVTFNDFPRLNGDTYLYNEINSMRDINANFTCYITQISTSDVQYNRIIPLRVSTKAVDLKTSRLSSIPNFSLYIRSNNVDGEYWIYLVESYNQVDTGAYTGVDVEDYDRYNYKIDTVYYINFGISNNTGFVKVYDDIEHRNMIDFINLELRYTGNYTHILFPSGSNSNNHEYYISGILGDLSLPASVYDYQLEINSEFGTVQGTEKYQFGEQPVFSVSPTSVSGGSGVRQVFTGWTSSSPGGYTGNSNPTSVLMNNDIKETATWKTQYYLSIESGAGGSVSPSSGWYDADSSVTITATPNQEYLFSSWIGRGTGSYSGQITSQTISLNEPITQTAGFFEDNNEITSQYTPAQTGLKYIVFGPTDQICQLGTSRNVQINIWFETSNGNQMVLQNGTATINGIQYDIQDGKIWIEDIKYVAGKNEYIVEAIDSDLPKSTPIWHEDEISVIWESVTIELDAVNKRINVGEIAELKVEAWYTYLKEPFEGQITIRKNRTMGYTLRPDTDKITYDAKPIIQYIPMKGLSLMNIGVESFNDKKYNLKAVNSNDLLLTWDEVEINLGVQDNYRATVNEIPNFIIDAKYKTDGSQFVGEYHFQNGKTRNASGEFKLTIDQIVDSKNAVSDFSCNTIDLIYDRIIFDLSVEDSRINTRESASIGYTAFYESDNEPYTGLAPEYNEETTSIIPSKKTFKVSSVTDQIHGVTAFQSDAVDVIWDEIVISMDTEDYRVNVGDSVGLSIGAYYAYDNQQFDSSQVIINTTQFKKEEVGHIVFGVTRVNDTIHGLTRFRFEGIKVVWDEVRFNIIIPSYRGVIGEPAEISAMGYFAYDGLQFEGDYTLNENTARRNAGTTIFEVSEMYGARFDITQFYCEPVPYTYDDVYVEVKTNGNILGKYSLEINVLYESDGVSVNKSQIFINGQRVDGMNGQFYFEESEYYVSKQYEVQYICPGLVAANVSGVVLLFGNTAVYFVAFFSAFSIVSNLYLAKKQRELAVTLRTMLSGDVVGIDYVASHFRNNNKRALNYLKKYIENNTLNAILSLDEKMLLGFEFLDLNYNVGTKDELFEKTIIQNPNFTMVDMEFTLSPIVRKKRNVTINIPKPALSYEITSIPKVEIHYSSDLNKHYS